MVFKMAIKCLKCNHVIEGGLHTLSECPNCGNTDRDEFCKVPDTDIDPAKRERDKKWLESHRAG